MFILDIAIEKLKVRATDHSVAEPKGSFSCFFHVEFPMTKKRFSMIVFAERNAPSYGIHAWNTAVDFYRK